MEVMTLLIALVALVIAIIAFQRTGGIGDLRRQVEGLSGKTETAREKTADVLDRFEHLIRGKEKPHQEKEGKPDEPAKPE